MHPEMVYSLPNWLQALAIVGTAVFAAMLLELIARRLIRQEIRQQHNDVAAAMFGVIGVTFAVLLAFVVMLSFESYGAARNAVASEAAVTRDVADAAAGLQEPVRTTIRHGLTSYLHLVMDVEWPAQAAGQQNESADAALAALNRQAVLVQPALPGEAAFHAALIAALAHLQDARALRRSTAANQVPSIVWTVVLLGGVLTVGAGSFLGAPSLAMHMAMSATLAASGALVVVLIVALSQPYRGDFRIPTTPYQRALSQLNAN
jgi:hypothetical protein